MSVTLKSLRWAVSQLQVVCMRDCVYGRIVSSFGKQRSSADRRETLPFSLFILCVWESGRNHSEYISLTHLEQLAVCTLRGATLTDFVTPIRSCVGSAGRQRLSPTWHGG